MIHETITVANLKCDGCATTITHKLSDFKNVKNVKINQEKDTVDLDYDAPTTREMLTKKLASLGYPEATEENGLLMQLKSYASCMVGRLTKD